ncbi:hypothetical protein SeMB42_g03364 [Synchytrium endobioticum]|uniref:Ubiquitin carboxyl-terminal hydrolase n=1 Tax=Synchytrium endobioticum TaxID=286115 RepID=A0A507D784_9FUNG|nr:hypothetical protein SeLEV6574_g04234 [Synchytrium endobioticum]TPX47334.1 hypothetical protein SeMB42_g03364 [Synchytrium endobioticum]
MQCDANIYAVQQMKQFHITTSDGPSSAPPAFDIASPGRRLLSRTQHAIPTPTTRTSTTTSTRTSPTYTSATSANVLTLHTLSINTHTLSSPSSLSSSSNVSSSSTSEPTPLLPHHQPSKASMASPSSTISSQSIHLLPKRPAPPAPRMGTSASSAVSQIRAARYKPPADLNWQLPATSVILSPTSSSNTISKSIHSYHPHALATSTTSTARPLSFKSAKVVPVIRSSHASADSFSTARVSNASSCELVGLRNLGNTCFMNSVIQCLNGIIPLVQIFLSGAYKTHINRSNPLGSKGIVTESFAELTSSLWTGKEKAVQPSMFKSTIGSFASQFRGCEQHDSHEFLSFLLDAIHEDLKDARAVDAGRHATMQGPDDEDLCEDAAAARNWDRYLARNKSVIVDLFQGQLKSQLGCETCGHRCTTFDSMMYLSVPVPSSVSVPYKSGAVTLDDCLATFHQEETLEASDAWHCPQCNAKRRATKQLSIQKLPAILLVHLKRFSFSGMRGRKVDTLVHFPLEKLDLGQYTAGASAAFDLVAVSNHIGSASGGHYTAYVQRTFRGCREWYLFDDARVAKVDASSIVSRDAYILFYVRRAEKACL